MSGNEIKVSASRINTFLDCKYKYWCSYKKDFPKVRSHAFREGLAVHDALDFAGQIWMKKGKFSPADKKNILKKYDEAAVREGVDYVTTHSEGKELVKKRIDNFELGKKIIGLEIKFGFGSDNVVTKDNVPLIGAIDKVIEIDSDTLLIVDYKTSKIAPTVDQLKFDIQLSIYDLVASKKWPNYKRIILSLDLLKSDIIYSYRTLNERLEFEEYLKTIYDQMVNFKEKDAKPQLNIFCPWCDYREYCKEYNTACHKTNFEFLSTANLSDEDLIKEWENIKATKKILEERYSDLSMLIFEKIKRYNVFPTMNDEEVYIRQNSRTNYDVSKVFDLVSPAHFVKMINGLNNGVVERYIEENPSLKTEILKAANVNFTKPFLAIRKKKTK